MSSNGAWQLNPPYGLSSLNFTTDLDAPVLGPEDVLVRLRAASLNPRDIYIVRGVGKLGTEAQLKKNLVPGSDGAGEVLEVGSNVTKFQPGQKIVTCMTPTVPETCRYHTIEDGERGLGQQMDGTLRRIGIFHQNALMPMPQGLSFPEAATLTCSGLTAWNCLMGTLGRPLEPGQVVVVQGTGGVSVAALQIAVSMKATVIATTSTEEKAARLRRLGASHVINYRETPEWGVAARLLTPDGCGADVVVETGGPGTMAQSMAATRLNGIIAIAGASGGYEQASPHVMEVLVRGINLRGIVVGGPQMYREFLEFIERTDWKPALDDIAFDLEDAQRAFERLQQMSHFSKIVINI